MMKHHTQYRRHIIGTAATALLLGSSLAVRAQQDDGTDEDDNVEVIYVTAQRVSESVQDVPIAVTALTDDIMQDRQVITPSDLQINAPNVSFSATNFGNYNFSIRGIGRLVTAGTGEAGVSQHLNEIAMATNLNSIEFFDMQRVEVLRGPQGTLYGRNSTGGAINFVTRQPEFDRIGGFADVEYGAYNHIRLKGAINVPFGETFGMRLAGYKLNRDGYIENLAHGQVGAAGTPGAGKTLPGIDEDVDGRDILALRGTFAWDITENANAWLLISHFNEDDDRARITNQVCKTNDLPTTGCDPNAYGLESPHLGATSGGIFGGALGALPRGVNGKDSSLYAYPRPEFESLREMHTDYEPVFQETEDVIAFGFEYAFETFTFGLIGARREGEYLSRQDYLMDVGPTLKAVPGVNDEGLWPVSEPAGHAGDEWGSNSKCSLEDGTSGAEGGECILDVDQTRVFAYDQSDSKGEFWTVEGKVLSTFEGPFNFMVGVSTYDSTSNGDYYVLANTLDLVTRYPSPQFTPALSLYPGFFNNTGNPEGATLQDGTAMFGEVYYDFSDRLKLTAGIRFNEDNKEVSDASVLLNSADVNAAFGGLLGEGRIWLRTGLFGSLATGAPLSDADKRLLEFHDAQAVYDANAAAATTAAGAITALGTAAALGAAVQAGTLPAAAVPATISATVAAPLQGFVTNLLNPATQAATQAALTALIPPGAAAFRAIAAAVPPVPAFGETRFVTNSPTTASWEELSGRIGLDYKMDDDTLIYGFLSQGYKPGGFNPAIPPQFQGTSAFTFDAEKVTSIEFGVKSTLLDQQLTLNGAFFIYDYTGLQIAAIRNNTAINSNVDADIMGLEIEGVYRFEQLPNLAMDFAYGWLNSKAKDATNLDPINRTAGNDDWIVLNNIDVGSLTGVNYIAKKDQITKALVDEAIAGNSAINTDANGNSVAYPTSAHPNGVAVPAYFSRAFLTSNDVETSDGLETDLDGNQIPNSPSHTFRVGLAYTWNVMQGSLTGRWDTYWQSESYAREFNTVGDEIESWMQHNASLIYETNNWTVRFWVRNILDDENVTGKYLTSDTSGFYRNYFLTEPRILGISARYAFE